jgi:hypothetical protein
VGDNISSAKVSGPAATLNERDQLPFALRRAMLALSIGVMVAAASYWAFNYTTFSGQLFRIPHQRFVPSS